MQIKTKVNFQVNGNIKTESRKRKEKLKRKYDFFIQQAKIQI